MRIGFKTMALIAVAAAASGCMSDEYRRADGLTDVAGDAIAANSVMQMVDPWQYGVHDTKLVVPAERANAATSGGDARQTQTMTSGN